MSYEWEMNPHSLDSLGSVIAKSSDHGYLGWITWVAGWMAAQVWRASWLL
jgi:hypothetical protein